MNRALQLDGKTASLPQLTPMKRLVRMLSLDRREILMIYSYAIFNGMINLSLPLGVQAIIGFVLSAEYSASWGLLIFIVVVGVLAAGIIQIFQLSLTELLQQRIFTRASFEFAYRIPRLKIESLSEFYAPELMNRFFDTLTVQKGLSKILVEFSSSTLQIIFGLILLSFYHPFFVFFGLILMGLMVVIFALSGPKGLRTSILESKYKYQVAHWLEELARAMGTFKLAVNTDLPLNKTNEYVNSYLKFRKQHFKVLIFQFSNIVAFKTLITAGVLVLGSVLVINQEINLGQFVASEIIILLVLNSVEKLILSMETVYDVLTGIEKLGQVTDIPIEQDQGIDLFSHELKDGMAVELSELSYRYPDAEKPSLQNLNLKINAGEKVCITGKNRSGKSTLMSLISGLFHEYKGSILFNDIPLRDINIMSFRSMVGDNLHIQDLFSGTLAENITVGRKVSTDHLIQVLKQVGLESFLKNQPNGLHTQIKPEGLGISDSEKKKIILARILCQDPKLIIMDHGMEELDYQDRLQISQLLTDPDKGWTLLVVTGDPLFSSKCDRLVTLEDGKIVDDSPSSSSSNKNN